MDHWVDYSCLFDEIFAKIRILFIFAAAYEMASYHIGTYFAWIGHTWYIPAGTTHDAVIASFSSFVSS